MDEFKTASLDTPVDESELKELVARLSTDRDHRTRVRDIAETMDVHPDSVIEALNEMRRQKMIDSPIQKEEVRTQMRSILFPKVPRKVVISAVAVVSILCFVVSYQTTRVKRWQGPLLRVAKPGPVHQPIRADGPFER